MGRGNIIYFYEKYISLKGRFTKIEDELMRITLCGSMSDDTTVETEILVYPFTSLVAEFGGCHGLFLGFSFMALRDGIEYLTPVVNTASSWCIKMTGYWNKALQHIKKCPKFYIHKVDLTPLIKLKIYLFSIYVINILCEYVMHSHLVDPVRYTLSSGRWSLEWDLCWLSQVWDSPKHQIYTS